MAMEIDNMNTEERRQNEQLLRSDTAQKEFQGYYYDEKGKLTSTAASSSQKKIIETPSVALLKQT